MPQACLRHLRTTIGVVIADEEMRGSHVAAPMNEDGRIKGVVAEPIRAEEVCTLGPLRQNLRSVQR